MAELCGLKSIMDGFLNSIKKEVVVSSAFAKYLSDGNWARLGGVVSFSNSNQASLKEDLAGLLRELVVCNGLDENANAFEAFFITK
jgi:hypothetical protein